MAALEMRREAPLTILLVEDVSVHVELIRRAFESRSDIQDGVFDLSVASTLKLAREAMCTTLPHLIIADLHLPDGTGVELLADVKAACPVVIMTAHNAERMAVDAIKTGALDYVVKSEQTLADMPRIAKRAMREWRHIVERRRAEQALRESEEKYRQIFANESDAIVLYDAETLQFIDANKAALKLYGYEAEEFLDMSLLAISAEPDKTRDSIMRCLADGFHKIPLRHHKSKLKAMFPVEISAASFSLQNRQVICAIIRDISERMYAEQALRISEERFRDFAETAADWFWEIGPDLRFSYISERYLDIVGIPPEQHIGKSYEEIFTDQPYGLEKGQEYSQHLQFRHPYEIEYVWWRPDKTTRVLRSSAKPVVDAQGVFQGYRGSGRDVTEAHKLSAQLSYQASHDALTGLVNRREFEQRLKRLLEIARLEQTEHALCYLDLDQFKIINDTCGHAAGDELLRRLAALLQEQVSKRDTLVRLGGDEFGVLMERCSLEQAKRVAGLLLDSIAGFRFVWEGKSFDIGVSIGLVPIDAASENVNQVLRIADNACYAAKDKGRNRVHIYHEDDADLAKRYGEMQWVTRIKRALRDAHFQLYCQTIAPISLPTDGIAYDGGVSDEVLDYEGLHYEVLIRTRDEQGRLVGPAAFLPAAERYNLSTQIDRWVVNTALAWLAEHPLHLQNLFLCSINLSGHSLADEAFLEFVTRRLADLAVPAQKICFEITETAAISNLTSAKRFIDALKVLGCRFALDDFGSGLSSFAYLKNLPVDFLKIDGVFVKDIVDNPIDLAMVKSINDIGHVMGKRTIAEFVENSEILEKLYEIGVDYAQGYGIDRPRPLAELIEPWLLSVRP